VWASDRGREYSGPGRVVEVTHSDCFGHRTAAGTGGFLAASH
jgi:hypothetical protein